jgi:LacI family transcriptional regulator
MESKIPKNIKDVAKLAGVSIGCVSKYLNNKPYVSEKTKAKIEKAIKKLKYRPNAIAKSLVVKKSNCIGLLVRDITNPYYSGIIRGIEEYIIEEGYNYSLILSDMIDPENISDKYIDNFLQRRVDGIATTSDYLSIDYLKMLNSTNIPMVFINRYIVNPKISINYVIIDNFKGAYMITEHLIKLGHKNIAHISTGNSSAVVSKRLDGYKTALSDNGIEINDDNIILRGDLTAESGYNIASELLARENPPTAIFCINDYTAYGVIDYCFKHNIKIPGDISIAGFDDVSFSSLDFISLTTVRQPINDIGRIAAQILFDKIKFGKKDKVHRILEPEIVVRKSTGYPKKA